MNHFYDIYYYIMASLYDILFHTPAKRITEEIKDALKNVGDWYVDGFSSYSRVFGCGTGPHFLPKYTLERLALRDITY